MAFNVLEVQRIGKAVDAFVAKKKIELAESGETGLVFKIEGRSVIISEVLADVYDAAKYIEMPVAKAVYVKLSGKWKIYWMDRSLRWKSYHPEPAVDRIEDFIKILDDDDFAYFWG